MARLRKNVSWVVYKMRIHGKETERRAVCEQSEWDAMERLQPGLYTLVQSGIATEGEAERLARVNPDGAVAGDKITSRTPRP
jgi:hypothetical protein